MDDLLDLRVETLLARWPTAAQVFIAYRMACLGCAFSSFHTTRQALEIYDLEVKPFLLDLEAAIEGGGQRRSSIRGEERTRNA